MLIEWVVGTGLKQHINKYSLADPLQSAYKADHSTETALLCIQNDILKVLDSNDGPKLSAESAESAKAFAICKFALCWQFGLLLLIIRKNSVQSASCAHFVECVSCTHMCALCNALLVSVVG